MTTYKLFQRFLVLSLLFLLQFVGAQQYPVQVTPVLIPPYSLKLGDYATTNENKLQVQLLMTDLMEPSHQVRLRFSLESGLNATPIALSNQYVNGMRDITLSPGVPLILTNVELRALFQLQNLSGISTANYAKTLPQGQYNFCFEVVDVNTGRTLSRKSCATAYFVQYDPPMLSLPQNKELVQKQNEIQNIVFQWMPRQVAPNTRYIFTMKEIWDLQRDPVTAFLASPVLWKEEVYSNSLFYGFDKTQLLPGKRYAWQVQAKSGNPVLGGNPTEDNGVYKNNGLSEIFYFDYIQDCKVPSFLSAKNAGRGRVEIRWSYPGEKPNGLYKVQYRKKGSSSAWMEQEAYQEMIYISGLADKTEYEYRVGSVCGLAQTYNNGYDNGQDNAYSYSNIQYFSTDSEDTSNNYQCGMMPDITITNKTPLNVQLVPNEVFTAGDFPVTIIKSEGNGTYSGEGYIVVPYLADTKVKVSFSNIQINTDRQLISGVIETTYDPTESAVHYVSQTVDGIFGDQGIKEVNVDFPIDKIEYSATPPPGTITIIGKPGENGEEPPRQTYEGGRDTTIVDDKGNIWEVDKDGNVTKGGQVDPTGPSTSKNTEGVSGSGKDAVVNQYTAKGVELEWKEILFKNEQTPYTKFAFDTKDKTQLPISDYQTVKDNNGQTIAVPYKAVVNGQTDVLQANIKVTDSSLVENKIVFKTLGSGKKIDASETKVSANERRFELTLKGAYNYQEEDVIAVIVPKDSLAKQQVISSFKLVHVKQQKPKVHLVPLDDKSKSDLTNIRKNITNVYKGIGVDFEIVEEPILPISELGITDKIESGDPKIMSTYGSDQKKINNYYLNNRSKELRYVVFVTDKKSSTGQDGYMRLNGEFGYVYQNALPKTAAHELGHGIFRLEHPTASSTTLLMDYSNSETLSHLDWKQIANPAFKLYAFQEQSEGEFNGGYAITPNYKIFSVASSIITDEVDYTKEENKKYSDDGTLPGFKLNNKYYTWNYQENRYESKENSDTIIFDVNPIEKSKLDDKKDIYLFFNKSNPCGKTTYKYINANEYIKSSNDLPSFIHENNDNRKDLPCIGTASTNQDNGNNNWKFDPNNKSNDNNTEECNTTSFEYLSAPVENDIKAIKEAFIRGFNSRKSIQTKEREQGKYNHIQYVNNSGKEGSLEDIDKDDLELLEDKLHLLSYNKKDTYVGIVFLKRDYKQFYKADVVDKLALEVVKASKAELGGKKALLIVVPYTYKVSKETDCLPVGLGQTTDNDVVRYSSVKIDTNKKWMSKVLGVYKEIPKPLYINRYYKMADGKIIQKSIKADNVTGRPFINALTFYESNGYDEIRKLNDEYNKRSDFQTNFGTYQEYLQKANKIYFDRTSKEELEGSLENVNLWKSIPTDDLGKFREIYIDDVKLTNKLWEKSVDKWAWGSKVEIALNEPKEDLQLLPKHFYNFDKMTLVDDVVYGVVDGIGLIPGVDTFTDPFGAVYAGIRGDYTNATIYSASFAIPLAGSVYIKGALKAGEDASHLFGIVARKADNADGYILEAKKISDIGANEVHVSSIYYGGDQKLTQKVLDGVRAESGYIDGDYVRRSLSELTNNLGTLLSKIDNLPNLSAAERNALKADINSSVELENLFVKNIDKTDELSDAWKSVLNARGANSVLKKDVALINKVADLKKNSSFMQHIGGNEGLEKIIKNNVQAPCKSCGNSGSKYLKNMDEYLDDVEHFVSNFNDVSDAQRLITELKNGAQNTVEGGAFSVRMFKENPAGLFTKGQVSAIDLRFSEDVLNRFDVKFVNGFGEFKSYQLESISNVSINQLKQYLGATELTKLDNLHYYFDKQKLLKEYGTGNFNSINEATNAVKEKFKTIFTNKSDEIFSSLNQNIKNELGLTGLNARSTFNDLILDTNSKLYNFIEIK